MPFNLHVFLVCMISRQRDASPHDAKLAHYEREILLLQASRIREDRSGRASTVDAYWCPHDEALALDTAQHILKSLSDKPEKLSLVKELATFDPKQHQARKYAQALNDWARSTLIPTEPHETQQTEQSWLLTQTLARALIQEPAPIERCHVIVADAYTIELFLQRVIHVLAKPSNDLVSIVQLKPGSLSTVKFSALSKSWEIENLNNMG